MRRGVRILLEEQENWQVVGEAADGREALRLVCETKPDVTILDYTLPQMNGIDLVRKIKDRLVKTQVLMFTTLDRDTAIAAALQAGVRGYLLKSDSTTNLLEAVEALSQKKPYFSSAVNERLLEHYMLSAGDVGEKFSLTARERELVQLIAEGQTNKQAAYILGISIKTIETHRGAAMAKLNLRSTADLVKYAVRNDMVHP